MSPFLDSGHIIHRADMYAASNGKKAISAVLKNSNVPWFKFRFLWEMKWTMKKTEARGLLSEEAAQFPPTAQINDILQSSNTNISFK